MPLLLMRIVAVVLGSILVYAGFLYEDQEKRVQSRLENWWSDVHDFSKQALTGQARFFHAVALSTSQFLSKLFGEATVSLRSVSVSISVSTIPPLLLLSAVFYLAPRLAAPAESLTGDPGFRQGMAAIGSGLGPRQVVVDPCKHGARDVSFGVGVSALGGLHQVVPAIEDRPAPVFEVRSEVFRCDQCSEHKSGEPTRSSR